MTRAGPITLLMILACDPRPLPTIVAQDAAVDTAPTESVRAWDPPPPPWEPCTDPPPATGIGAIECGSLPCRTCWTLPDEEPLVGCTVAHGIPCVPRCADCDRVLVDRDR